MVLPPQSDVGAGVPPLLSVRNLIKGSDMSNATLPVVASNQSIIIPNAVDNGLGVNFEYDVVSIRDLRVNASREAHKSNRVSLPVEINGRELKTDNRFWTSLYSRYGFNSQFFKYFKHDEVFQRIQDVEKNDKIRVCVENSSGGSARLLAVSNPTKPVARYEDILELLGDYDAEDLRYHNGEITSLHAPRIGGSTEISGDLFHNKFAVSVPIDGYGSTSLYLAMLRQVCSNGMIAMSKAFRSSLQLGKGDDSVLPTLTRALDSFNNDEGFHALRSRIESSTKSWASVYEATGLYKNLIKMHLRDELKESSVSEQLKDMSPDAAEDAYMFSEMLRESTPVLSKYHQLTGDTSLLYGLANMDQLSIKRQKTLPVKCTMYELMNFATEVSSHHAEAAGSRRLAGWFGTTVSNEYDLEGTRDQFGDFADFHMGKKLSSGLTGSQIEAN